MIRARTGALLVVAASLVAGPVAAQEGFAGAIEAARQAWAAQDAEAILGAGRQVLLQLPDGEGRTAVSRAQAIRLVERYLEGAEGVSVRVLQAREVRPGQGYVELLRTYRVAGTDEARSQRVLLAFRWEPERGAWVLVELRVLVVPG